MRTEKEYEGEVVEANGGIPCIWFEELNLTCPLPAMNLPVGTKVKWTIVSYRAD